jgi:hypothetical protein
MKSLIPLERIENRIYLIRDRKVMLDRDLAELYGVTTFNLNKAVRRNLSRFPDDFMFRLTMEEYTSLRFQIGILKRGQHAKYLPMAFTQEGIAMLSGVLHSPRAIRVNIVIMRTFVKLTRLLTNHPSLHLKLQELETQIGNHDHHIRSIFKTIRRLITPRRQKPRIGFLGA